MGNGVQVYINRSLNHLIVLYENRQWWKAFTTTQWSYVGIPLHPVDTLDYSPLSGLAVLLHNASHQFTIEGSPIDYRNRTLQLSDSARRQLGGHA